MQNQTLSAQEALAKLKEGKQHNMAAETNKELRLSEETKRTTPSSL